MIRIHAFIMESYSINIALMVQYYYAVVNFFYF